MRFPHSRFDRTDRRTGDTMPVALGRPMATDGGDGGEPPRGSVVAVETGRGVCAVVGATADRALARRHVATVGAAA